MEIILFKYCLGLEFVENVINHVHYNKYKIVLSKLPIVFNTDYIMMST